MHDLFGPIEQTYTIVNCWGELVTDAATLIGQAGPFSRYFMIKGRETFVPNGLWRLNT